jgi:hypothetical protein
MLRIVRNYADGPAFDAGKRSDHAGAELPA